MAKIRKITVTIAGGSVGAKEPSLTVGGIAQYYVANLKTVWRTLRK